MLNTQNYKVKLNYLPHDKIHTFCVSAGNEKCGLVIAYDIFAPYFENKDRYISYLLGLKTVEDVKKELYDACDIEILEIIIQIEA